MSEQKSNFGHKTSHSVLHLMQYGRVLCKKMKYLAESAGWRYMLGLASHAPETQAHYGSMLWGACAEQMRLEQRGKLDKMSK